jgi:uncharacterized protein YkwD
LLLAVSLIACGVPLAAGELTATAENPDPLAAAEQPSSARASSSILGLNATPAGVTPTPLATVQALPSPTGTPATPTPTPVIATPVPPALSPAEMAAEVIKLLNAVRAGRGLNALRPNPTLSASAAAYAKLMAERNFFGHYGPDGSSPQSRIAAAGYTGRYKGETLAAGQTTPQQVLDTWLTSQAHAAIILEPTAVEIGVGYYFGQGAYYGHYWTLVTGAP